MGEPIVVGVAFIPKDDLYQVIFFCWVPVGRIGLDWNNIRAEWML